MGQLNGESEVIKSVKKGNKVEDKKKTNESYSNPVKIANHT